MFTSAACSCVRNGRKVSAHVGRLSRLYPERSSASTGPCRPLTQRPWLVPVAQTQVLPRAVSFSAASRADVASSGAPTDPAESAPPGDDVRFGSLSADFSSRRSFRKSSPDTQDLRFQDDVEEDLGEPVKSGRRNTPYWYFLQCKKLIKENKVSLTHKIRWTQCCASSALLSPAYLSPSVLVAAPGGLGSVQQRHAERREAAARGVQLLGADWRLWPCWTPQEGLQTLQ